jgi:AAA15 family ATPase/GTPase
MLLQFSFKNYKSFRDDTVLDLTAEKITELANQVVCVGNEKILPLSAIYGANASGKSNVLDAFRFMHMYVIHSFAYGGDSLEKNRDNRISPVPFLFDDKSKSAASTFEVYYITSEAEGAKTYQYGFSINKGKVIEEWLNYCSKTARGKFRSVFYRNTETDELDLSGLPKSVWSNIKVSLEPEVLVASLGAKLKVKKLKAVRDWFLNNEFTDFGSPEENFILSHMTPENFLDEEVQKQVVTFLSTFDPSIVGFHVEDVPDTKDSKGNLKIDAIHKIVGSDKTADIPLQMESAGTLKMFALYPMLHSVLEKGSTLFVDELNGRLHPLLVRNILSAFINPAVNKKHAQIVFTTHDPWSLNNGILRRDEIWFTEKDTDGISSLYSLVDFVDDDKKIRKDENYEKNYLVGKYGGIPNLKPFIVAEGKKDYGKK